MLFELNTEGCALSDLGIFHVYASIVVFLYDAFGEREPEPPPALFRGIAWGEDGAEAVLGYAFAGVAEVDVDVVAFGGEDSGEGAVAFHSIDGVLADVFDNPFEEVLVDGSNDGSVG